MVNENELNKLKPPERRRFLQKSLTGSVPLLVDWVTGRARQLVRAVQEPTVARKSSPPPAAPASPPAPAKQILDEHYAEFARDNPSARSLPEGEAWDETATAQGKNERGK